MDLILLLVRGGLTTLPTRWDVDVFTDTEACGRCVFSLFFACSLLWHVLVKEDVCLLLLPQHVVELNLGRALVVNAIPRVAPLALGAHHCCVVPSPSLLPVMQHDCIRTSGSRGQLRHGSGVTLLISHTSFGLGESD